MPHPLPTVPATLPRSTIGMAGVFWATVVLDRRLLPSQLSGTAQVGPAYKTFEEAFKNKAHANCHIAEVILFDRSHSELAHWWELSQSLDVRGVGRAGDTEQKALVRVHLKPGHTLEIRGAYNPCTLKGGCDIAMQTVAKQNGAEIIYRTYSGTQGTVHHYPKDDFQRPLPAIPTPLRCGKRVEGVGRGGRNKRPKGSPARRFSSFLRRD